jgi:hypothetical protein
MTHEHSKCQSFLAEIEGFKIFFNLADEIPNEFLSVQLIAACLKLQDDTSLSEPPTDRQTEWQNAQYYLALAYALPHLNTFTLDGAARAERLLATQMDARFMDATEVNQYINLLMENYKNIATSLRKISLEISSDITNNWIAI